MNSTLKTILIILISGGIFSFFLNLFKKRNPEFFSFTNKIPEEWKGKWVIRWTIQVAFMFMMAIIVVVAGLNDTIGSIIIGFFLALTELVFRKANKTIER